MDHSDGKPGAEPEQEAAPPPPDYEESIVEEVAALIDDGRTYAQAEIAFQKTRAKLVGRHVGIAVLCGIIALILLNIAFLALAVGLVMALEPLVTIWGAIAIVVGGLFLTVGLLALIAVKRFENMGSLFEDEDHEAQP